MKRMYRLLFIILFVFVSFPVSVHASDMMTGEGEEVETISSPEEMTDIFTSDEDLISANTIMIDSESLSDTHDADKAVYFSKGEEYYLNYSTAEETQEAYQYFRNKYGDDKVLMDLPIHTMDFSSWGNRKTNIAPTKVSAGLERKNKVLVALIDSGVNRSHAVFAGRSFSKKSKSYVSKSWKDDCGHGTHTAGIIAEATSKNVRFLVLKVTDRRGNGSLFSLLMAMDYAADCKAKVANISLGINLQDVADRFYKKNKVHLDTSRYVHQIEEKIADCRKRGLVIVCAAGNNGSSIEKRLTYPAKSKQVIAVGACDRNGKLAPFSNYGSALDFLAPGVSIKSAYLGGKKRYKKMNGTSMAAPHITAEAAMIRVYHPSYKFKKVYETLVSYTGRETRISDKKGYGIPVMPAPTVKKASGIRIKSLTAHSLKIRWRPISNAQGYTVYMLKNGAWQKLKSTKKYRTKTGSLELGKQYYFKVRGFYKASGRRFYGPMSDQSFGIPVFAPPKNVKIKKKGRRIRIRWKAVKGATGYQLFVSDRKKGPYKLIRTAGKPLLTVRHTCDKREYYKLRAYKIKNGRKCYGRCCLFHDKDEVVK